MKQIYRFLAAVVFLLSLLSNSVALPLNNIGRWIPASNTAIAITGEIIVSDNRILFQGDRFLELENGASELLEFDPFGKVTALVYDVKSPVSLNTINGNTFAVSNDDAIVLLKRIEVGLGLFVCKKIKLEMNKSLKACDSYFYSKGN